MVATKIIKPGGSEPDEFEKTVSNALLELELNSELKAQLRDLHITRARELECGSKKVKIRTDKYFVKNPIRLLNSLLVRDINLKKKNKWRNGKHHSI